MEGALDKSTPTKTKGAKMGKRKRRERDNHPTKHHIKPRARGGTNRKENIAIVPRKKHHLYHELFKTMTPDEIITDLVLNYWSSDWGWVYKALDNPVLNPTVQRQRA